MSIEQEKIRELMEVFDRIASSFRQVETEAQAEAWFPSNESEKSAFARLTAKENRNAIKTWYASAISLNSHADLFRQKLERAIAERIK